MKREQKTVEVFADWRPMKEPHLAGTLTFSPSSRGGVFSFAYADGFLASSYRQQLDPMLQLHKGAHYNDDASKNFRAFLDSCPDRWGRILMQRRAAIEHRKGLRTSRTLDEMDYLLGVHDSYRMGAIRFRYPLEDRFLDANDDMAAPPMTSLRELEHAAIMIEQDPDIDSEEYYRWIKLLIAPGSSLGGARPKACVQGQDGDLWIAKFPNGNDDYDIGAWEMVAHRLAVAAGIDMAPCNIQRFNSNHHTFLTRRFDRDSGARIHFSSAMTQLKYYDGASGADGASYLEIAEFLTNCGASTKQDLAQLWRRIVFNIAISNCDDHLRNHGFILEKKGWRLSPAYDLNPLTGKHGLSLNISDQSNDLDFSLAMDVSEFFQLKPDEARMIKGEVLSATQKWNKIASEIGISRGDQSMLESAFIQE